MRNRSTTPPPPPPPPPPAKRLCIDRHVMGYLSDSEISVREGPEAALKGEEKSEAALRGEEKSEAALRGEEKSEAALKGEEKSEAALKCEAKPEAALNGEEKPEAAEGPEAAPKAAGYYWFKLKLGEPLTSEEEAKAADYSLEDLLDEGLDFCTICGQEDHWVYCCEKYYEEYKCPYGTNFIPPGINQHDKMPSDVWTDSDQEHLDLLCIKDYVPEGFEYLHTVSEVKNIHRIMIQQHNEIKDYVNSGIEPDCAVRKTGGESDDEACNEGRGQGCGLKMEWIAAV